VLFCLLSHKTGRLLVPLFMLVALAANVVLRSQFPYNWLLVGQVVFYGLAVLGGIFSLRPKILRLPYYFCMINSALFAWVYRALRHGRAIPSRVELDQLGNQPRSG
jgi:poly-beta-1,6-N-acetyl-D-glucosamine synthase